MRSPSGSTARPPLERADHRVGTGPDSIYLHAVVPKVVAGGPVAVCGYPLRETTLHAGSESGSFETLARGAGDCCPECRAALGLDAAPASSGATARPASREWMKWLAFAVGGAMSLGGLVRVAIAIVHHT